MLRYMQESLHIIIEANHDPDMLEMSSYPNSVKARILSHIWAPQQRSDSGGIETAYQG
ncbi:hypothetical protein [Paenibacillus larvae]|uniref:hypothetical protein n=1 Tax=Paenibacillus larvae TaxID=1464 RepID=UPI0028A1B022|nr:hypothetical protein [Paenibacillus larvae]